VLSPDDELKQMLEKLAGHALDNIEKFGFHLPVCLGHSPTGESVWFVSEKSSGGQVDFQACRESVLQTTRLWISEGKIAAVAFATVVHVKVADPDGTHFESEAVKILVDHVDKKGYAAYLPYRLVDGKAIPEKIYYHELPERFFARIE
jgi:hypothetical protein